MQMNEKMDHLYDLIEERVKLKGLKEVDEWRDIQTKNASVWVVGPELKFGSGCSGYTKINGYCFRLTTVFPHNSVREVVSYYLMITKYRDNCGSSDWIKLYCKESDKALIRKIDAFIDKYIETINND